MIGRRDLIKWGMAVPALVAAPHIVLAHASHGLDALLIDERIAPDLTMIQSSVPLLRFAGDVTKVWYETIDPAWRERGYVLGGITGSDTLFVLETLASQHGRRVVSRTPMDVGAISWIIAPIHPSVMA